MNKLILFGAAFLLVPLGNVFGVMQTNLGDEIFVFVQTSVRNSNGVLVVYLESSKFTNFNATALDSFLDYEANGNDPIITVDDKKYQVIRRVQSITFDSEGLVASTILSYNVDGKPVILARFAHDGYTVLPGDTLESLWTFVRLVA